MLKSILHRPLAFTMGCSYATLVIVGVNTFLPTACAQDTRQGWTPAPAMVTEPVTEDDLAAILAQMEPAAGLDTELMGDDARDAIDSMNCDVRFVEKIKGTNTFIATCIAE